MINWFLGLEPVNRLLLLTACAAFIIIALPGIKINLRSIIMACILIVAALFLFTLFTNESPKTFLEEATEPPAVQKAPLSVPEYYKDPEKRYQENLKKQQR